MLRRLLAHIDALGDRVHPIVVLQLRRHFRRTGKGLGYLVWTIILALAAIGVILYDDVIFAQPGLNEYRRGLYGNTLFVRPAGMMFIFLGAAGAISGFAGGLWQPYWLLKKHDPLMVLTPMSERQFYVGFYQVSIGGLFSFIASLLPYLTFAYLLRLIPLSWVIVYPFVFAAACWMLGNICYSIALTSRTLFQRIILLVLFMMLFYFFGFTVIMLAMPLAPIPTSILYVTEIGSELLRFELWFPVFCVAVALYSFAAWRLIDYNLDRRRSFWRKLFRSLSVYAAISVFLVGLWFALRWMLGRV